MAMSQTSDHAGEMRPKPLVISRTFPAPRALVFRAWSNADHLRRWFSPDGCTVPEATVDFRPGGVFDILMRTCDGQNYWSRGTFVEVVSPERLVFTSAVAVGGACKFTVHTTVMFEELDFGTRMTVRQEYDILDPDFGAAVAGASEGWRTTLDKLEREIARIQAAQQRSAVHATFSLERTYDAAPATVFHALTNRAAKERWFTGGDDCTIVERAMDVRPGGREWLKGRWKSGSVHTFDAIYFDVVSNARLVYAYEMHLDDRKISVSLATMELHAAGAGTRLTVTEQGAFLDGYDDNGSRVLGTGVLLDRLGASLRR
jgi:uncharacterized protein YndB with AHSA1/START domain